MRHNPIWISFNRKNFKPTSRSNRGKYVREAEFWRLNLPIDLVRADVKSVSTREVILSSKEDNTPIEIEPQHQTLWETLENLPNEENGLPYKQTYQVTVGS